MRPLLTLALLAACHKPLERPSNTTCLAPARVTGGGEVALEPRFAGLSFTDAVALMWTPGAPGAWYVVEQDGRILRFDDAADPAPPTVALDLTAAVDRGSESGLLGLAFHPDFAANGYAYVNYTAPGPLTTRIARFTSRDGGATFDPASETVIFSVEQPFSNHNAGHLAFGPDGLLYFGLGDGGSGGDPLGNAQNLDVALGKMLRLDVDGGTPYAIPPDNPFASGGGLPEIYAWGIRNPWRFSFDSGSGELWLGDVGQNDQEEVDRVVRGGNYGWNITEGKQCYEPPSGCDEAGLIAPLATYVNPGQASVVGGIVYRGTAVPDLVGTYLYADFYGRELLGLDQDGQGPEKAKVLADITGNPVHFVEGPDREAWILTYGGDIYTVVPTGSGGATGGPAARLSETGCVDPNDPTQPAAGLLAYGVAVQLWSDGLDKQRWLAIPDDTTLTVGDAGDLDLPIGAVLVKEFAHAGTRVETRLLVHHDADGWAGYTYRWRDDGSDADLLPAGLTVDLGDQDWGIPTRAACAQCHTDAAGGSLGLETRQLGDRLAELVEMGVVTGVDDPDAVTPLPTTGSPEERARGYLHVNCSPCHRPDGGSRTDLDFRFDTTDPVALGIDLRPEHGDLGVQGARVIVPGDPEKSLVWLRMSRRDANQMPPLGTAVVDQEAADLVAAWISAM